MPDNGGVFLYYENIPENMIYCFPPVLKHVLRIIKTGTYGSGPPYI